MSSPFKCNSCAGYVPMDAVRCPHCGVDVGFPNVRAAEASDNMSELDARFAQARVNAGHRGTVSTFDAFQAETSTSGAVWCKYWGEANRLAQNEKQGAGTYYQQIEADMRIPDGDVWDRWRRLTDETLFPGYKEQIRFAALTLDTSGPQNYGPVSLVFRTERIEQRATVFHENSVTFMLSRDAKIRDADKLAIGFCAPWPQRGRLAVAKHEPSLSASTPSTDFPRILLRQGASTADDDFVEVHIYGSVTIRTIAHVRVDVRAVKKREGAQPTKAQLAKFEEYLKNADVKLEVVR